MSCDRRRGAPSAASISPPVGSAQSNRPAPDPDRGPLPRNKRTGRAGCRHALHFPVGYKRGEYAVHALVAGFTSLPALSTANGVVSEHDWAVLTLDRDVSRHTGLLGHSTMQCWAPATRSQAGYSRDHSHVLTVDRTARCARRRKGRVCSRTIATRPSVIQIHRCCVGMAMATACSACTQRAERAWRRGRRNRRRRTCWRGLERCQPGHPGAGRGQGVSCSRSGAGSRACTMVARHPWIPGPGRATCPKTRMPT